MAFCEPTHLDQVLSNLVGKRPSSTRWGSQVHVSATSQEGWLEVAVADEGQRASGRAAADTLPGRPATLAAKAGSRWSRVGPSTCAGWSWSVPSVAASGSSQTGPGGTVFKFTVPSRVAPGLQTANLGLQGGAG